MSRSSDYRPEIDGLRAIAVTAVVLDHAGLGVPGGFAGVDVFFVISGYVITRLIRQEMETGKFSLLGFYDRRIRRLFPALTVVLLTCAAIGIYLLVPEELSSLGRELAAAAVFGSNILFRQEAGYFDPVARDRLLLHTWSLGVEEQFYLLWPIGLFLIYKPGRLSRATAILIVASGVSLALSVYLVRRSPAAGFYLLPSRGWELGLGAILALLTARPLPLVLSAGLSWLALVALFASFFVINPSIPFPGAGALLPCGATALLIYVAKPTWPNAGWLLSLRPVRFIGIISFSLYLWHWPLLVGARLYLGRELSTPEACALVVLALMLASLSWRYVEQPFRRPQISGAFPLSLKAAPVQISLVAAIGLSFVSSNGFPQRLTETARIALATANIVSPLRADCHVEGLSPGPIERCTFTRISNTYEVLLWGDSHADHFAPMLHAWADRNGVTVRQASKSTCPPLLGSEINVGSQALNCKAYNDAVLNEIISVHPVIVMLAARWSVYESTFDTPGQGRPRVFTSSELHSEMNVNSSVRALQQGIEQTLRALAKVPVAVLIMGEVPPLLHAPTKCAARAQMTGREKPDCAWRSRSDVDQAIGPATALLKKAAEGGASYFDTAELMCTLTQCRAISGSVPIYRDDNHLSVVGAISMADKLPPLSTLVHKRQIAR